LKKIEVEQEINLLQKLEIIRKKKGELIGTLATIHRPLFENLIDHYTATQVIL